MFLVSGGHKKGAPPDQGGLSEDSVATRAGLLPRLKVSGVKNSWGTTVYTIPSL